MAIACLALAVSLSGVGYAAVALPKNSVGTPHLKTGAVTSKKVRNHSLRAVDFKRGQLRRGAVGSQGPKGDRGEQGSKGDRGERGPKGDRGATGDAGEGLDGVSMVSTTTRFVNQVSNGTRTIACPAGKKTLGGGYLVDSGYTYTVLRSEPSAPNGWLVEVKINDTDPTPWTLSVFALCGNAAP